MIRILTHVLAQSHSKLPIADKIWYCSVVSITFHLTYAYQVIKLKNEGVTALFHQLIFLQFLHIAETGQIRQLHDPHVPFKHRFIASSSKCTIKDLLWLLAKVLTIVNQFRHMTFQLRTHQSHTICLSLELLHLYTTHSRGEMEVTDIPT